MKKTDQEEKLLIHFSDILSILRSHKKKILTFGLVFASLCFFWGLFSPIRYLAEGTFREKGIKESSLHASNSLVQLLTSTGSFGGNESEATSLMTTRSILKSVIERHHLQANLQAQSDKESYLTRAFRNLKLTYASLRRRLTPVLADECCPLKIEQLSYTGEIPLAFTIDLKKGAHFDLIYSHSVIGQGELGVPFQFKDLSFTLVASEDKPISPQIFNFSVDSLENTAKAMSDILKIESGKADKSLLKIKYSNRNRHVASAVVNAIMDSFQAYSKNYHTKMALQQVDYLSQRRDHLTKNLTDIMHKHAEYLANDLYGSGFIESNKEMDFLARSQHEYKRKLLDNELEIKRLTHLKLDDFTHYDRYSANEGDPTIINTIFSEMRGLKQQRDALEIEIQKKASSQQANMQLYFEQQLSELKEVRQSFLELKEIKATFEKGDFPNRDLKLYNDPRYLLKAWFDRLQTAQIDTKNWQEAQDSIQFYLNNLERLFGVHERILQERLTHQQNPAGEYQGINLEVATDLYRDFSKQLIQIESNIRQNSFFIHQIDDPNFEITSLSAGLTDPISSEIIHKASQLVLNLRDQTNQSIREQDRIRDELNLERTFLTLHLQQMVQLMQLNKQLLDEKIFALQNVSLELIHQRISLLEKNLQDYLQTRLYNLHQERDLIKRHLENIHAEMAQLPQKWVSEQLLTQEVTTNHLIVEEIARLVETKNISHNLEILQSTPVDLALSPVHPVNPKLFMLTFLGFVLGGFIGSCQALASTFNRGLPASGSLLEQKKCHFSGNLSLPISFDGKNISGGNLETLRRLQLTFEKAAEVNGKKLLLLLEGDGPHYAPLLAELFNKRGRRVVILDINFHHSYEKSPGLLQYLKGEIKLPPIQKGDYGDFIAAGGETFFANEMIASDAFKHLVDTLGETYDWIIAVSQAGAASVEGESLLSLFPNIAVTLKDETIGELNAYFESIENSPNRKITFVKFVT